VRGENTINIIRMVNITVTAKGGNGYMAERGDIVSYMAGGPERAEIDVGIDEKDNPAGKRDGDKDGIRDPVVPGVNDND
jgi:hypothetical protein